MEGAREGRFAGRWATGEDVKPMMIIHRQTIREFCSPHYEKEVIDEWASPITEDKISAFRERISSGEELVFVVFSHSDDTASSEVAGFGTIVPLKKELCACYVSPKFSKSGVGSLILKNLFSKAKELKIERLSLSASLNSVKFYEKNGCNLDEKGEFTLRSGRKMPCWKMHIDL